jgi:hypothetical protein
MSVAGISILHSDHPFVPGSTDRDNGLAEMPGPNVFLCHTVTKYADDPS